MLAGVRFPGLIHPGLIGTAPSHELLKIWNDREHKLVEDGDKAITLGGVLATRPLGMLLFCLLLIVRMKMHLFYICLLYHQSS